MEAQEIFDLLASPFAGEVISWRVGPTNERSRRNADDPLRGQPLAYIDARDVMDRLDAVMGPAGWQCHYTAGVGASIVCNIGLIFPLMMNGAQIGHHWIFKGDGAGPSDTEPEKGALSDAFKRAAVRWGIGRYLYDLKAPWIALEKRGNTAFIPDEAKPALDKLHDDMARRVGWGGATNVAAYRLLCADLDAAAPSARKNFAELHRERIAALPPSMRAHLQARLEKE